MTIGIEQDARAEAAETLTLRLTAAEVGAGGGMVGAGTVSADVEIAGNAATLRTFSLTTRTGVAGVAEGDTVGYLVTLNGAAPNAVMDVAWSVAGVGANPAEAEDFVAPLSGMLRFTPQDGSGSTRGFVVEIAHDTLNEGDERYRVSLAMPDADSSVSGTPVVTIADDVDDRLVLSIGRIDSGDLSEGAATVADRQAEFVVSVGNATATAMLTIPLTVSGAGVSADDYTITPTSVIMIAQGVTTAAVTLGVLDDNINEGAETLRVELGAVAGALGEVGLSASSASATIAASDEITVSVARLAGAGGAEGTSAVFVVTLSGGEATSETTVGWDIAGTGANPTTAADFVASSGQVRVPVGDAMVSINVQIVADDLSEVAESYTLTLGTATGGGTGQVVLGDASMGAQIPANIAVKMITVSAGVYLEGAYDAANANLRTGLINALPSSQPYTAAPWNYSASTTVPHVDANVGLRGITSTIVDWVLMELRTRAPGATGTIPVLARGGRAAALLLSDGRIVGINEAATTAADALSLTGVRFAAEIPAGHEVYVAIHHRNHLSVMSEQPVTDAGCAADVDYCVDFRRQQSYADCDQARHADGSFMMFAGDVNRSGSVAWGDDAIFLVGSYYGSEPGGREGYRMMIGDNYLVDADLNFDGSSGTPVSRAMDEQFILANNLVSSECRP